MKKAILFHLIFLLLACNQSDENKGKSDFSKDKKLESTNEKEPINEEEIISEIRKQFEEINQNTDSYKMKSKEIMGESAEGGELKSYYRNGALRKVVASYYGEIGKSQEEYYFSEKTCFLFLHKNIHTISQSLLKAQK